MKTSIRYIILFVIFIGIYTSCKKTTDTTNNGGNTDSTKVIGGQTSPYLDTVTVIINNVVIKYSRTNQCYPSNEIFAFSATASGLPSGAVYNWDFGDGHTTNGANPNATVGNIYQTDNYYTVTLTINDANKKGLAVATLNLHAYGQQVTPHASFYAELFDINYPNNLNFNGYGCTVTNGKITNYAWNWGDNTTSSSAIPDNIPHNFPQIPTDATYPVKLVVTASSGCKDSTVVPVAISAIYTNISGSFNAVSQNVCTAESITFTSNATNVPKGAIYLWDFADNVSGIPISNLPSGNPISHSYAYQNNYGVTMYISLNGKIIYTSPRTNVTAYGQNIKPVALFLKNTAYEDSGYVKWAFYDQSNIPHGYITGRAWTIDNVSIDPNTNDTYETQGYSKGQTNVTHTIKLVVTSNSGCKDTASSVITIPIFGHYTY